MRLRRLHVVQFRNLTELHVDWGEGRAHFLEGDNGQGKSNVLEAIGLLAALRSFRAAQGKALIQWGRSEARLLYELEHEQSGTTMVELTLGEQRRLHVDGEGVSRLSDFVGRFPVVALSSEDFRLVRGRPEERRRFLDTVLASASGEYLGALRTYNRGLKDWQATARGDRRVAQLMAFEAVMAPVAATLVMARRRGLEELRGLLATTYGEFAPRGEVPELVYMPAEAATAAGDWRDLWARKRAVAMEGQGLPGPHRDDWGLRLNGQGAREGASEGQQRSLVLALRLAEARWLAGRCGVGPIMLADDVLGELDPGRRESFWRAMEPGWQLFAAGTRAPESQGPWPWRRWRVADGQVGEAG